MYTLRHILLYFAIFLRKTILNLETEKDKIFHKQNHIDLKHTPNLFPIVTKNIQEGKTPIHAACENDHPQVVQMFLDRYSDLGGSTNKVMSSLYYFVVIIQYVSFFIVLLGERSQQFF